MGFKLKRLKQCAKCPWKKSTNPHDIPNGYCDIKHGNLKSTIAKPGDISNVGGDLRIMACHEHDVGEEAHCVGWLANQLGAGNNIALRLNMMNCENAHLIKLGGEQHECFEDTLPKGENV